MLKYSEKQFKDLLGEFITSAEKHFDLIESEDLGEFCGETYNSLYKTLTQKLGNMILHNSDAKQYGIDNIGRANMCLCEYRYSIANTLCSIFSGKHHIELLELTRKCTSWSEVMSLHDKFIKIYEDNCRSNFISNIKSSNNEGLSQFIYIMYLALYSAYTLNDSLYNELNVSKKNFERLKYDYIRNGLPFRTTPYLYIDSKSDKTFDPDNIKTSFDLLTKIEFDFINNGHLSTDLMCNHNFLCLANSICIEELNFNFFKPERARASLYRYIDLLESTTLSYADNHIELSHAEYLKLDNFNKTYINDLQAATTIEDIEALLEKYKDTYSNETKELRKSLSKYISNSLRATDFFSLKSLVEGSNDFSFISRQEFLVIVSHLRKLKIMLVNFCKENLDLIGPELLLFFNATEDRIHEIKNKATSENINNVNTKKINKKIAKYKKAFDFKEINKLAENAGFSKVRQKGDHGIFQKLDGTTVVIPQGRTIGKGLSFKIQKEIENSKQETEISKQELFA